eukprot:CAMPEP_0206381762 /NCGR_PEP_ID=MMETSP0294-20121207/12855_1 /ASSEMBLY_ACC=CAM_ASM_000327 /TAXON_ID=39354 /ORGANISM="Heterosigma akashiwo, Strain CCMP2393" /LENGTH=213 /DNA_ID=CAMNT_0053831309 /DNA_START=176 /DNA_END=814 /DNA_ORIENTATION=+
MEEKRLAQALDPLYFSEPDNEQEELVNGPELLREQDNEEQGCCYVEEFLVVDFKLQPKFRKRPRASASNGCFEPPKRRKNTSMRTSLNHDAATCDAVVFGKQPQHPLFLAMRTELVKWMVELTRWMEASPASFNLAIHLFDKYTEKVRLPLEKFQLIGTVCMMLSCKYNDRQALSFEVLGKYFDLEEVRALEFEVLEKIDFSLSFKTVLSCIW